MSVQALNESPTSAPHLPLWRDRDYILLWSGQFVSSVGTLVSGLAFPC